MVKQHPFLSAIVIIVTSISIVELAVIPFILWWVPEDILPWDRITARQEVLDRNEHYDMIALGDSTGVQGIVPTIFAESTGKTLYNFSTYSSTGFINDIFFLRGYLMNNTHKLPEAILVTRSIHSWRNGPTNKEVLGIMRRFSDTDTAKILRDLDIISWRDYLQYRVEHLIPTLRKRQYYADMRQNVENDNARKENRIRRKNIPGMLGYEPFNRALHRRNIDHNQKNIDYLHQIHDENNAIRIDNEKRIALQQLCKDAQKFNIPVFIFSGPHTPLVAEDDRLRNSMEQLATILNTDLEPYPNCTYVNTDQSIDEQYLSDLTHTLHDGAVLYTERLAEYVTTALQQ